MTCARCGKLKAISGLKTQSVCEGGLHVQAPNVLRMLSCSSSFKINGRGSAGVGLHFREKNGLARAVGSESPRVNLKQQVSKPTLKNAEHDITISNRLGLVFLAKNLQ